jgi:hypothetical protein
LTKVTAWFGPSASVNRFALDAAAALGGRLRLDVLDVGLNIVARTAAEDECKAQGEPHKESHDCLPIQLVKFFVRADSALSGGMTFFVVFYTSDRPDNPNTKEGGNPGQSRIASSVLYMEKRHGTGSLSRVCVVRMPDAEADYCEICV